MDSFERVLAAFKNLPVDRPPVFPQIGDHAGIINGLSYDVMYKDATKAAEAHLKSLKLYGYDVTTIQVEPSWPVVEACGASVVYPPTKYPWITNYLIETKDDLENLYVPDFMQTQSSRVMIEGTKILAERANVPVVAFMTGPLTFSLQLMKYEKFITLLMKDPFFVHEVIRKALKIIEAYVKELKKEGAIIFYICEHDVQMMPPKVFREFSLNYLPGLFTIFEYNILHLCGKVSPHLSVTAESLKQLRGLNTLSIGHHVDIATTIELLDHKIGLAGNIDHIKLLPHGTPKEIEIAVHNAIRSSGGDNRFIVSPGCEITTDTPIMNVKALVQAARNYH
jgi:uroporphyrinogen decarboxylase